MAVQCAKCGEELMGSVNRCWRCGQEFVARSSDGDLPPIRRSPVVAASTGVLLAELSAPTPSAPEVNVANAVAPQLPTGTVRRGSPFGDRGTATLEMMEPDSARTERDDAFERESKYRTSGGATASAALTIPLGLVSFAAAFLFPLAGILLALIGIGFSVWGLCSRRRGLAVAGLLFCFLSLALATFNEVVAIYTSLYGVAPWASGSYLP